MNLINKYRVNYLSILFFFFFYTSSAYAQQWGDYTLYSVMNATTSNLLDTNGTVVKTWTHTSANKSGYSCYLMPGGYLWRSVSKSGNSFTGGPISGQVQKVDWSGTILWDYVYSTTAYCSHHDICPLPNGNVLLIAYERKTALESLAAGSTFNGEVWPDKVVEIKPTGATTGDVVWEWKIWDHIVQDKDSTKLNYQKSIVNHPELLNVNYKITKDWIHMNGVDYNPILDQIAVSSHNINEWYIIDHSTTTAEAATHSGGNSGKGGDFLYRWGNPAAYNASGTQVLKVTHDSHWIPEGVPNAGRMVGFNNQGISTSKSSVDQIVTPVNGYNYNLTIGSAYEPTTYDRHACNGYTSNAGCSEQLPNGNMLVCIALSGTVYETNPQGTSIWTKTVTGSIQQAHRYNKCFTDNQPPTIPEITLSDNALNSTSATTYKWFLNGQELKGETSQTLTPTIDGIYVVRITDINGCVYRYSKGFTYKSTGQFNVNASASKNVICQGDSLLINASIQGELGTTQYTWGSLPTGFSSNTKQIKVWPSITTIYTVIATNNAIADTSSITISVNPKPSKPTLSQSGNTITSSNSASYTWFLDQNSINVSTTPVFSPTKSGIYRVKVKDSNGCESEFSDPVSFTASVHQWVDHHNSLTVYPNPGSDKFALNNPSNLAITHIIVTDILGKTIVSTTDYSPIDLSESTAGLYYIKVFNINTLLNVLKVIVIK